jgi:hypothetical protein
VTDPVLLCVFPRHTACAGRKSALRRSRGMNPRLNGASCGRAWLADIGRSRHRPSSRKLWRALREVDTYLRGQSKRLVNYAKRYRAGLRVGTSVTEGTANFLVNRRMNKAQQMRWSRRGADLLLQVRCAVYNGAFGSGFGKLFEPTSNTVQQSPLAA